MNHIDRIAVLVAGSILAYAALLWGGSLNLAVTALARPDLVKATLTIASIILLIDVIAFSAFVRDLRRRSFLGLDDTLVAASIAILTTGLFGMIAGPTTSLSMGSGLLFFLGFFPILTIGKQTLFELSTIKNT